MNSRDGLSKLSRVSRDWGDVANIYLWECLDDLLPLLCLLPTDCWEMVASSSPLRRVFSLTRPLTPLDWAPVLRRSSLVKALWEPASGRPPRIGLEALRAMCCCPPPFTLLPRLQDLSFLTTYDDPQFTRSTFYLQHISPSLRILQVQGTWPTGISFLRVAESCPRLDTLDCDFTSLETTSSGIALELAGAALMWRSLTDVSLGLGRQALATVLSALARHPALRSMTIRCHERPRHQPILPEGSFPSLQHLIFFGCWLPVVDAILGSWTVRPINTISIKMTAGSIVFSEELTHTMRCIQEHCEPLGLLELLLHFESQYLDAWRLSPEHIAPLSHFSNLVHVVLRGPGNCDIDADACAQLARWWPRLERLLIGPNIQRRAAGRLCPLSALRAFAVGCPKLRDLMLPLTANEVPDVDSSPDGTSVRQYSLMYLNVGDAPIENPEAVAHFLTALFPDLQRVEYEELVDDEEEQELDIPSFQHSFQRKTWNRVMTWDRVKKALSGLQV
ncbi:hypothetical protein BD626DRAFT_573168 [Schizophyllum amplum]|uniref:F-box domain-containing protein n=1 Tax=Schizophyllum amplum TaxID=97359 RepID=A0A550C284_9AGAR|nr:hypothetical protein BD626DRAFT_573168 [Auriculariopsis ampla]